MSGTFQSNITNNLAVTNGSFSWTLQGPFTTNQVITVNYYKIGRIVQLDIPTVNAAASTGTFISSTAAMPTTLFPLSSSKFLIVLFDNSGSDQVGAVILSSSGILDIFKDVAGDNFTGSGNCGWDRAFSLTYLSAT